MKKILGEFKEFISKGNVLDLAVGVIIGTAFSKIVNSLVNDILMPFLGVITGGHDFSSLSIQIKDATITYGAFIQNIIDFLLMAICVFVIVKLVNNFKKGLEKLDRKKEETIKEEEKKEEVKKSNEEKLLEEIRDLLKDNNKVSKKK